MNIIEIKKDQNHSLLLNAFHTTVHFSNDFYLAFFAPTLPVIINNLNLLKVQAGFLNLGLQLSALIMPFIGRLADRRDFAKYIVFTPLITGICMSLLGVMPNYLLVLLLMIVAGLSSSFYHAVGPAEVGKLNDKQLGQGLAVWNIAGQIGFMLGPLAIAAVISIASVKAAPILAIFGLAATAILFFIKSKFNNLISNHLEKEYSQNSIPSTKKILGQFIPITLLIFTIVLSRSCAETYLPIFLMGRGSSLWQSGLALSIYMGFGIIGNFLGGYLFDRIDPKKVIGISLLGFTVFFISLNYFNGGLQLLMIACMGIFSFMFLPVIMAFIQQKNPGARSLTSGLFLAIFFVISALGGIVVGYLLDHFSSGAVFLACGFSGLVSLPIITFLKS